MSDLHDDTPLMSGSATTASGAADDSECPLATLWLPDPDAWRGWSMRHVWRKDDKKPERRLGFRRSP